MERVGKSRKLVLTLPRSTKVRIAKLWTSANKVVTKNPSIIRMDLYEVRDKQCSPDSKQLCVLEKDDNLSLTGMQSRSSRGITASFNQFGC